MSRNENDDVGRADRGTELGSTSRFLERVFSVALNLGSAVGRTGAASRKALAWLAERLAAINDTVFGALARASELAAHAVGALLVWPGRWIVRICRAVARVLTPIVRVVVAALAAVVGLLVWICKRVAAAIRRVIAALKPVVLTIARRVGAIVTACLRAFVAALAWTIALAVSIVTAIARVVSPVVRAAARAMRAAARVLVGTARALVTALGAASAWMLRGAGNLREHLRATSAWFRRARLRLAYDIGVAAVRARQQRRPATPAARVAESWTSPAAAPPEIPFDTVVHQNEYLARDTSEVDAIITVTAHGDDPSFTASSQDAAEVIILDCSGSMGQPWRKLREARRAAMAAIDEMRDGTFFAIVRGTEDARVVFPLDGTLVRASDETRDAANVALRLLWPEGGTAMSTWLSRARELLASRPNALRHAILLTDGRNESDDETAMTEALDACAGVFRCDCRGVGTEWDVEELRRIALRLDGTLDMVADPADLADDFAEMTGVAMAKRVDGAKLRVWIPQGGEIRSLKQMSPEIRDLTTRGEAVDALTREFAIGAWGDETRDYHLCVRVPPGAIGGELLASRVGLVVGDRVVSKALVKAIWTDDVQLSTPIDRSVAHFSGQAELADNIRLGLEALRRGEESVATKRIGDAVKIAARSGNAETLALLERVAVIDDARNGKVRPREKVDRADEMLLDTRSERTVPARV
jgi:hypothetical protein